MNLRQLRAFQEVMLTRSVTKAAFNIGRTQPAISFAIAELEKSIGYQLFERQGGRLHPVPEAHFLLAEATEILAHVNNLDQTMRSVGALDRGHLKIACLPVFANRLMPKLISNFVESRKNVSVSLFSDNSLKVYDRLASQQFDIGVAEIVTESPLVEVDKMETNCLCAVSQDSPLAQRTVITPRDLDGLDIASFVPKHTIRRQLSQIFESEGREFRVRFEMQNAVSQYVFVEDNRACAIMSPFSARNYIASRSGQSAIQFIPFRPKVKYGLAILRPAHKPLSRLAQVFYDALKVEITAMLDVTAK